MILLAIMVPMEMSFRLTDVFSLVFASVELPVVC